MTLPKKLKHKRGRIIMTAFKGADILLPEKKVDMEKWSVIACDQFTSEPEYWAEVKKLSLIHI